MLQQDPSWMVTTGKWMLVTLFFHRFWLVEDPVRRQMLRIALLNNVAVIGGLLLLLHGADRA
jgi:hypothetical protein